MALPYTFGTQSGSIPLNELDENFTYLENLVPPLAVAAATVTAASQPNITSLGTVSTLLCSGTITSGTITANIINGTLQTASQPNITEIGSLADLTVSNVLTVGTMTATQVTSVTLTGTISTPSQPGITTVGTLGSLSVTGNVQGGNLRTTGLISATGNVTGGNLLTSGVISATGTITTAGALTATGNVSGGNLSISGTSTLTGVATAPTAANGVSNTQVATTAFVSNSLTNALPSGVIVMWSGSVASIPTGWLLCNGSSGTPDLRNRFIVGAGSTYNPGTTGGSADSIVVSHTHTATSVVTDPGHNHTYQGPTGSDAQYFSGSAPDATVASNTGNAVTGITVATTVASSGTSGTNANLPPYYALAYIMKS